MSRIVIITSVFTLLIILFSGYLSRFLVDTEDYKIFLSVVVFAAPFGVSYAIVEAFLRGYKEINKIVMISLITNVVSSFIFVPFIYYFNLSGVAFYLLIFGILPFLVLIFFYRDFLKKLIRNTGFRLSHNDKAIIFKLGMVSLVSSLMHQGTIIIIRKIIISNFGYNDNGIYQSVLSVSISYFGLVYIFLTNYSLPSIAECKSNEEISKELNQNSRFLLLIMIPMIMLFYGFKDLGILILFSKNFVNAGNLFLPQFIGDIFRVGAALFGLWLIPKHKIKQLIIIDTIFNVVLFGSAFLFISVFSLPLILIPVAYMISFLLHFSMYYFYARSEINFKFDKSFINSFLLALVAFVIVFLSSFIGKTAEMITTVSVVVMWFYLVVTKDEILEMKNLVMNKLKGKNG